MYFPNLSNEVTCYDWYNRKYKNNKDVTHTKSSWKCAMWSNRTSSHTMPRFLEAFLPCLHHHSSVLREEKREFCCIVWNVSVFRVYLRRCNLIIVWIWNPLSGIVLPDRQIDVISQHLHYIALLRLGNLQWSEMIHCFFLKGWLALICSETSFVPWQEFGAFLCWTSELRLLPKLNLSTAAAANI